MEFEKEIEMTNEEVVAHLQFLTAFFEKGLRKAVNEKNENDITMYGKLLLSCSAAAMEMDKE